MSASNDRAWTIYIAVSGSLIGILAIAANVYEWFYEGKGKTASSPSQMDLEFNISGSTASAPEMRSVSRPSPVMTKGSSTSTLDRSSENGQSKERLDV